MDKEDFFIGYFTQIPNQLLYDQSFNGNEIRLYGMIMSLSNQRGYCWATNKYFSEQLKVSVRSIQKMIKHLEEENYIITFHEITTRGSERRIKLPSFKFEKEPNLGDEDEFRGDPEVQGGMNQRFRGGYEPEVHPLNYINKNNINKEIYIEKKSKKVKNGSSNEKESHSSSLKEKKEKEKSVPQKKEKERQVNFDVPDEIQDEFAHFMSICKMEELDMFLSMPKPLLVHQYKELKKFASYEIIHSVVHALNDKLETMSPNKRYKSAYSTLLNWVRLNRSWSKKDDQGQNKPIRKKF